MAFLKKNTDGNHKNGKIVSKAGEEQCHHCRKKNGHWIDECPDLAPDKRDHIKKDRLEWWVKKNGYSHTKVGKVVDVTDTDFEVEARLSMLVAGKNDLGGKKLKPLSQTRNPKPNVSPRTRSIFTVVSHTCLSPMGDCCRTSIILTQLY